MRAEQLVYRHGYLNGLGRGKRKGEGEGQRAVEATLEVGIANLKIILLRRRWGLPDS